MEKLTEICIGHRLQQKRTPKCKDCVPSKENRKCESYQPIKSIYTTTFYRHQRK